MDIENYLLNRAAQLHRLDSEIERELGLELFSERVFFDLNLVVRNTSGLQLPTGGCNWRHIPLEFADGIVNNMDNFTDIDLIELRPLVLRASLCLEYSQNWFDQIPGYISEWIINTTSDAQAKSLKAILRTYATCLIEISAYEATPETSAHRILAGAVTNML